MHKLLMKLARAYLARRVRRRPPQPLADLDLGSVRRVLLISATALGDTLFSTPAIRALKERYPAWELEVLAHRVAELKARTTADEAHVEARVVERLADLVQGNQALSLLFVAVSADEPGLSAEDFAARLASRWVHEGRIHAAGVAWEQQGPVTVLSSGEQPIGPDDVPGGLLSGLASGGREGHPVEVRTETLVWLAVAVPQAGTPGVGTRSAPAALLAAWPLAEPPTDADRVACAAVARYLGLRASGATQTGPVSPAPTPAAAAHPARHPANSKAP